MNCEDLSNLLMRVCFYNIFTGLGNAERRSARLLLERYSQFLL